MVYDFVRCRFLRNAFITGVSAVGALWPSPKESRDELFGGDVEVDYDVLVGRCSRGVWVVMVLVGLKVF